MGVGLRCYGATRVSDGDKVGALVARFSSRALG